MLLLPCCIGVRKYSVSPSLVKQGYNPDRIYSVRFEAALINLNERFIMIYATKMIKACRFITPVGNGIPLIDPEKQFSCFVWIEFFSFFWLFFSLRI